MARTPASTIEKPTPKPVKKKIPPKKKITLKQQAAKSYNDSNFFGGIDTISPATTMAFKSPGDVGEMKFRQEFVRSMLVRCLSPIEMVREFQALYKTRYDKEIPPEWARSRIAIYRKKLHLDDEPKPKAPETAPCFSCGEEVDLDTWHPQIWDDNDEGHPLCRKCIDTAEWRECTYCSKYTYIGDEVAKSGIQKGHECWISADNGGSIYCSECVESHEHQDCTGSKWPGWWERGITDITGAHPDESFGHVWGFNAFEYDVVSEACNYYLLLFIRDGLMTTPDMNRDLKVYRDEAADRLLKLVARLDPVFCAYADMVVGGELRYHGAASRAGLRYDSRSKTWNIWRRLRQLGGTQVLEDASFLFRQMNTDTSNVGGEAWAVIAETLTMRLKRKISPELWIDRVFNLQHNGGTMLNKVGWGSHPCWITSLVGPAHNDDQMNELTILASEEVRSLFAAYIWEFQKLRFAYRLDPLPANIRMEGHGDLDISTPLVMQWKAARDNGLSLIEYRKGQK